MSLTSATQTAITSLFGTARLRDLTNPRNKSASSVDWDVVEAAIDALIDELAAVGTAYTESNNTVRRNWVLCIPDYDRPDQQRAALEKYLERHQSIGVTVEASGLADDDDLETPITEARERLLSREKLDANYRRGARGQDADQRRRA